jgi:hypothetical protein
MADAPGILLENVGMILDASLRIESLRPDKPE